MDIEDSIECSICLEPLKTSICTINCGHKFHTKCMIGYANSKNQMKNLSINCPICRSIIIEHEPSQEMIINMPHNYENNENTENTENTENIPELDTNTTNYYTTNQDSINRFANIFLNIIVPISVIIIIGNIIFNK